MNRHPHHQKNKKEKNKRKQNQRRWREMRIICPAKIQGVEFLVGGWCRWICGGASGRPPFTNFHWTPGNMPDASEIWSAKNLLRPLNLKPYTLNNRSPEHESTPTPQAWAHPHTKHLCEKLDRKTTKPHRKAIRMCMFRHPILWKVGPKIDKKWKFEKHIF